MKDRLADETSASRKRLREAELELEGRRLEIAALREKVRGLEMLTRNAVTSESIDRQFAALREQARRVGRRGASKAGERTASWPGGESPGGDH